MDAINKRKIRYIDETGHHYGMLTVIEKSARSQCRKNRKYGRAREALWICLCACGRQVELDGTRLRAGLVKSCGCQRDKWRRFGLADKTRKPAGEHGFNRLYRHYAGEALRRGLNWELSHEQFREITSQSCEYCGIAPSSLSQPLNKKRMSEDGVRHATYIYNGVDRVDNEDGYLVKNCVPCCSTCNFAKREMSKSDFLLWIKRIYSHTFRRQL